MKDKIKEIVDYMVAVGNCIFEFEDIEELF